MAVKSYNSGDNTHLSPHFSVQEFKCKCGKEHEILIADELIEKLEKLYDALNCSKIIVTSGYRCPAHDKAVGGTSSGQHTKGNAADIVCYGQDGQPVSSKLVCCKAQDIGFGGIANITIAYTSTHVDVRTGYRWLGNEVVNYHTVTDDFYKYYGISADSSAGNNKEDDIMNAIFGIDVSKHNGTIDWNKVKAAGVKFAILRAGYGRDISQKDVKFEEYYRGAKAVGIPVGAYWYSYASDPEDAKREAAACIEAIKGKQFEYPIYFDLEEKSQFNQGKAACTAMVKNFCDALEKAGYWAGLYMSRSPFTSYIDESIRTRYALWLAEYNSKLNYSGSYGMWQNGSGGTVDGISGRVDTDYCYVDYPTQIKSAGLNGYTKTTSAAPIETPILTESTTENKSAAAIIQIGDDIYKGTLTKA